MADLGVEKMSGLTEEQRQAFERAGFTVYSPHRKRMPYKTLEPDPGFIKFLSEFKESLADHQKGVLEMSSQSTNPTPRPPVGKSTKRVNDNG